MAKVLSLAACLAVLAAVSTAPAHAGNYYGWHGAYGRPYVSDPSLTPNPLLRFYRQHHICAIDEGYGRATRCD